MEAEEREVKVTLTAVPAGTADFVKSGILLYGNALVGPWVGGPRLTMKATFDTPFKVPRPRIVLMQPRQLENDDFKWPDQFALMVNETAESFIRFTVTRIDTFQKGAGWGQNLSVDVLVVDDGTGPSV